MKRLIALMIALGFCAAYSAGCTKMAPKAEEPAMPAAPAEGEMAPPPPPPPAPAAPAEEEPAAPEEGGDEASE